MSDTTASWTHSSAALTPSTMTLPVQPPLRFLSVREKAFLFTYCFRNPAHFLLFQWLIFIFSWMSFNGAALGGKKGLYFQLSALGFESTGSNNVHPEQTSTCFSTIPPADMERKKVNTGDRSGKQKLHKELLLNSCRFMGSQTSFPWDLVSLLCFFDFEEILFFQI